MTTLVYVVFVLNLHRDQTVKAEVYTFLVESDSENGIDIEKLSDLVVNYFANKVQGMVDQRIPASEYPGEIRKLFSKRCIVKLCTNHSHEGKFIGDLCSPCYNYIALGEGTHSQIYRNSAITAKKDLLDKINKTI